MTLALDPELEAGLRRLRLRGMRELAPELLQTAKTQRWPPHELLATLVRKEIASREASNERARLKAAGFPAPKTLEHFDLGASQLPRATFEFLASRHSSCRIVEGVMVRLMALVRLFVTDSVSVPCVRSDPRPSRCVADTVMRDMH